MIDHIEIELNCMKLAVKLVTASFCIPTWLLAHVPFQILALRKKFTPAGDGGSGR